MAASSSGVSFDDLRRDVAAVFAGISGLVVFLLLRAALSFGAMALMPGPFSRTSRMLAQPPLVLLSAVHLHETDAVGLGEVVRVRRGLLVRAAIDKRGPRFAIGAAFDS